LDKQGKKYQKMKKIKSLYLHVPHCLRRCNYCDFYHLSGPNPDWDSFESYLYASWPKHQELLQQRGFAIGELENLYLGGGTPALWGERGAKFLTNFILERGIVLSPTVESTLELNPGGRDLPAVVSAWEQFGVNRFSIGVQSLRDEFLELLGRNHTARNSHQALEYFADRGLNYSVDLMLGLPYSAKFKRDIADELNSILRYSPPHISIYILTTKPDYSHNGNLPDEEWIRQEYLLVSKLLVASGYQHYEVSNFAQAKHKSAHNLEYWQQQTVAALGPSASGLLLNSDRPSGATRYRWSGYPADPRLELECLNVSQLQLERIYMNLRSEVGLNWGQEFNQEQQAIFVDDLLPKWSERGYLAKQPHAHRVVLGSLGYLMLDSLLEDLYPLLPE
jgi:oxygen-independent coproporphyrinogen III oxidase